MPKANGLIIFPQNILIGTTTGNGIIAVHKPTNISAWCTKGKSQYVNKHDAVELLVGLLEEFGWTQKDEDTYDLF